MVVKKIKVSNGCIKIGVENLLVSNGCKNISGVK